MTPSNSPDAQEHKHRWSLANNSENKETYSEEDRKLFWDALWLCPCGTWKTTKYKWENRDET